MPGVVIEGGSGHATHTNHDRDTMSNGINGVLTSMEPAASKAAAPAESQALPQQSQLANGSSSQLTETTTSSGQSAASTILLDMAERVQQLPPEIIHITEGFEPLSKLLSRLAQVTHNRLSAKVMELTTIPVPSSDANGNGMYHFSGSDDNSADNVRKKVSLLKFANEVHANWTKALVISQWSRVSADVSRIIDLKIHLDRQKNLYEDAFYQLMEVKRGLQNARLPNPDLRTAVEVLTTGKASWMPNLTYIDSPPLTAKELLHSLQTLDTLLSMRLNLHEYDKMPPQFKDYSIKSGRVTFRVAGEFEVDLTIGDEDPEKQFWFIDFRFLFKPTLSEISEQQRYVIEGRVNTALEKEGLAGCYKYLHELVLTHKISEFRRQAIDLGRGRWIDTLQVEPLRRAVSIQYWVDRYGKDGPRSWIILGVHSGKRKDGRPDPRATSHIGLRWFRESKEVKDHGVLLELNEVSAEHLLQMVISEHVLHILGSAYRSVSEKQLYSQKQLSISLDASDAAPKQWTLAVQLTRREHISVTIEQITGLFCIRPASRIATQIEWKMNNQTKDPAANAHEFIENLRCVIVSDQIINRALGAGWIPVKNPGLKQDDLKPIVPRDTLQLSWFRRIGWDESWIVVLSTGMSGERWWLFEITNQPQGPQIKSHVQMLVGPASPNHTHTFLCSLHLFAAAMVTYYSNLRALHGRHIQHRLQNEPHKEFPSTMKLPIVCIKLSDILPSRNRSPRTGKAWAKDFLKIRFQGLEYLPKPPKQKLRASTAPLESAAAIQPSGVTSEAHKSDEAVNAIVIAEAYLTKPMPPSLDLVKQRVDKDIAFHPTSGAFAFRFHNKVGEEVISQLVQRLSRIEQLVDFVEVVKKHERTLHCDTVALGQVIFSYNAASDSRKGLQHPEAMVIDRRPKMFRVILDFSGPGLMTLTLERGNPQLRILDHLKKTLNSPLGLEGVAKLIPLTLTLMTALDAIEEAWTTLLDRGEVLIFNRAVDWHIIRYILPPTSADQKPRKLMLEIRLAHRGRSPWWCLRRQRERERDQGENQNGTPRDEFDKVLKKIWDDNQDGERWRGMSSSAIATPDGVLELFEKVDEVIRDIAIKSTIYVAPPPNLKQIQPMMSAGQRGAMNNSRQPVVTNMNTTARANGNLNARTSNQHQNPNSRVANVQRSSIVID